MSPNVKFCDFLIFLFEYKMPKTRENSLNELTKHLLHFQIPILLSFVRLKKAPPVSPMRGF